MSESSEHEAHPRLSVSDSTLLDTISWLNQQVIGAFRISATDLAQRRDINRAAAESQSMHLSERRKCDL